MEVYILDSLLRRIEVVDRFESLIWTERFVDAGDFELKLHSTPANRRRFVPGIQLAINESYRVMTVETVENSTDDEGRSILQVKGRSLEAILEDRVAWPSPQIAAVAKPQWSINGTPGNVVREMFRRVCVNGEGSLNDKIPFIAEGTMFPQDNIPEPPYTINHLQDPASLYDAIKNVCDLYDLGFRLIRDHDNSKLYFNVYTGSDRTSGQKLLAPVIFAPELDNLQNTSSLHTIEGAKNVAYVYSEGQGSVIVYPDDVDPEVEGFERRMMLVQANDIKASEETTDSETGVTTPAFTQEQVISALIQKGREELSKKRAFQAFDGEIDQNSSYRYGVHYNLGDLVEIRNVDGEANNMRVTEQIFVSDKEGERSYPTLTLNLYINPGSWLTWDFNQVWLDLEADPKTWAEA